MQKIFTSLLALALCGGAYAQTDVTATYIKNADFSEGTPVTENIAGYDYDKEKNNTTLCWAQEVEGWTIASAQENGRGGGLFAYGSTPQLCGGNVAAPATNPSGEAAGNALGIFAVWKQSIQYTQDTTLPAGKYTLSCTYYNSKGTEVAANLIGFVEKEGTAHYLSNTTFTTGEWTTVSTTFTLDAETDGAISIGYSALDKGSQANPMLFIDNVKLTKQIADGTDMTSKLVNPSFESDIATGWTQDGSISFVRQGNSSFGKDGSMYAEYWQPNGTLNIYQTVTGLPAGLYNIAVRAKARGVSSAALYLNETEAAVTIADNEAVYTIPFQSTGETDEFKIGFKAEGTGAGSSWVALDNFTLTYVSDVMPEVTALEGKMNADVKKAMDEAIATYNADKTFDNYNAAVKAISTAQNSVDAYAKAKTTLDNRAALLEKTNFYKADDSFYTTPLAAYEAGTLTDAEAQALEDPYATSKIGWHASTQLNQFFGAAWGVTDYSNSPYINTWSIEGDSDGSDFKVPFYEYWTGDGSYLADVTKSATIGGLKANAKYSITAAVRVRVSDNGTAPATGITMQVGDGTAVDIIGTQVGSSKLYLGTYTAIGSTDEEGNLTLKFNVSNTNVSWLSFQHVKYAEATELPDVEAVTGKMNKEVSDAQDKALEAYKADKTADNYTAALAAVSAAQASVNAYAKAKTTLDNRAALLEKTNFYKADDSFYTTPAAAYEAGTLTDSEAQALEDPYATSKIAWHKSTQINQFFGAAWGVTDYSNSPYINTWSIEGDSDGSDFKVPFYEYWTGDGSFLADGTKSGTIGGLKANAAYDITAAVRVRLSNNQEAPATGINMQVGDGEAVAIEGTQVGTSQMYLDTYTATGFTDAEGNLTLKFNITNTNVSWLSFQHVKYVYNDEVTTGVNSVNAATTVSDGAAYNLAGQRVGNSYKGVVIVNGKKQLRK